VNLFWGKIVEASLVSSLVAIMWYIYGLVFAENITDTIKKAKGVDATTPDPK
jgi:ABC-type Na+ efflux pump permease subunit